MINPISANANSIARPTKTSIFYVNDLHGQTMKMEKVYNASKVFDSFVPSNGVNKLKLSSGDIMLGENKKPNTIAAKFLDLIGVTATAVGNHECDMDPKTLHSLTADKKFKMLGMNAKIEDTNPLKSVIQSSYIEEKEDGQKYGIIGLMPPDLFTRMSKVDNYKDLKVDEFDKTVKDVQAEVEKFKEQGINKVIVLSHLGNAYEKRLAQETAGIDVILGGHSHELIKDVVEGENLLYGKDGNPVVITQAGKDADNIGVLNLEFDKDGVISKVQNNVSETKGFRRNLIMKYYAETVLGKPEVVGTIKSAEPEPANRIASENPHANLVADAMRFYTGADLTLLGSANLRNTFESGEITTRDISSIVPFKNGMAIVPLSEKTLVDALKYGAESLTKPGTKPGLLQVSGLTYNINKAGELLSAEFTDKMGNPQTIDVKNPSEEKTFKVAMDTYYANGRDGFEMLKSMDKAEAVFDEDKDYMVAEYIKNLQNEGKEIEIKNQNRITIVD